MARVKGCLEGVHNLASHSGKGQSTRNPPTSIGQILLKSQKINTNQQPTKEQFWIFGFRSAPNVRYQSKES
jgi:hypothetical protein